MVVVMSYSSSVVDDGHARITDYIDFTISTDSNRLSLTISAGYAVVVAKMRIGTIDASAYAESIGRARPFAAPSAT
jgi:hypothetical protein